MPTMIRTTTESIDTLIRVEQVTDAEFYAGDLFRRRFGSNPPDYPWHYVALYKAARNSYVAVGYIHYIVFEDNCLCGGMVADERALRRMPATHQAAVREGGGIVTKMLRDTCARYIGMPAIWVNGGDPSERDICARAGFLPTTDAHVMVRWNRDGPENERAAHLARIVALGPF
ncbi:MAG: hypothetical protein ABI624_21335 [Casimicrobiaceae bacterium]